MRAAIKYVVGKTYKPVLAHYLSRTRFYNYPGIRLEIPPDVFHPAFFSSTKLLLNYIKTLPLQNSSFLEPGAGSGLISFYAAQRGAKVTATDINPIAIEYLRKNAENNRVDIKIIPSDLFENMSADVFDIIAINPPYFKKKPVNPIDFAWYCGEQGEYFEKLFRSLGNYIHEGSVILMVLCNDCDLDMIRKYADENGFSMECLLVRKNWVESNFIFSIKKNIESN
ncbi:MAG TPA: HemK2/MTQ2 family protein methyltransferase [Chitinophagaceae bacterium]|nr:HemK2/MTQ2 family protein methyltransferase [Chitinophagaceae bacterium]